MYKHTLLRAHELTVTSTILCHTISLCRCCNLVLGQCMWNQGGIVFGGGMYWCEYYATKKEYICGSIVPLVIIVVMLEVVMMLTIVKSMHVDEEINCWIVLAMNTKARTVAGRVEKNLLCDPGSELRPWRKEEKEGGRDKIGWAKNGNKKQQKLPSVPSPAVFNNAAVVSFSLTRYTVPATLNV